MKQLTEYDSGTISEIQLQKEYVSSMAKIDTSDFYDVRMNDKYLTLLSDTNIKKLKILPKFNCIFIFFK